MEKTGDFWLITIFDENDTIEKSIYSDGKETVYSAPPLYLAAGNYYARVTAPYAALYYSDTTYTIQADFMQNTGTFEAEPNDTRA